MTSYAADIIYGHLSKIKFASQKLLRTKDVEALHHLRVETRRIRNALWVFKSVLPQNQLDGWRKKIKSAAKASSMARDLDIQINFLKHFCAQPQNAPVKALLEKKLIAQLVKKRHSMQANVLRSLKDPAYRKTIRDIETCLKQLSEQKAGEKGLLLQIGEKRISKTLKDFLSYKKFTRRPTAVHELHEMRIAAKHLRYTMESFKNVYGPAVAPFIETVTNFQRLLGDIHDYDVWVEILPAFIHARHSKDYQQALAYLKKECVTQRKNVYTEFYAYWKDCEQRKVWEGLEVLVERSKQ